MTPTLQVVVGLRGRIPSYGSPEAIGLDIFPADDLLYPFGVALESGHVNKIKTDISIAIPQGWYGRLAPKSGPALKWGVEILAGVIDSDYRGEIIVLATCARNCEIPRGKAICQLILERADRPVVMEVEELTTTERGEGGFGSTGR